MRAIAIFPSEVLPGQPLNCAKSHDACGQRGAENNREPSLNPVYEALLKAD